MNRKLSIATAVILIVLIAIVASALALQGRNGTNNDTPMSESQGSPHTEQGQNQRANEPTPAATTNEVAIVDFAFTPKTITVTKGTTVTWTNNDTIAHTVTSNTDKGPSSDLFGKGETYSYTFNELGTFDYHCKPHPNMTGTVVVTEK